MEIITDKGEHLDIASGYSFDFEFINPLLSDVGSQTAPGTLPYTPRNLRTLEFPDRLDNARRPVVRKNVILREGCFQKKATQVIMKANPRDKIVTTFYMDEAIFYEKIKSINMNEINYGYPRQMSVQQLFTLCENVMFLRTTDDFHLFPAISDYDINVGGDTTEKVILNKVAYNHATRVASLVDQSLSGIIVDGKQISVPFGYGVAPFLKVSFVIRKVIEHFGYSLENNVFDSDESLKQLVLVNNVADAIVKGILDYKLLVPTCTVSEFIRTIQNKFGIRLVTDEAFKVIRIVSIDEQLALSPDIDLTPFATEPPRVDWAEKKRLHLTAGTSISGAEASISSVEDLVNLYGPVECVNVTNSTPLSLNKLYYSYSENVFCVRVLGTSGYTSKIRRYSPLFDYISPGDGEIVELASSDEQLPMFRVSYDDDFKNSAKYLMPGIPATVLVNSTLIFSDDDGEQAEKKYTIPVMFCFSIPRLSSNQKLPVGTTNPYDNEGYEWGTLSLNITWFNGLRDLRYARYDLMLARSNHLVNCLLRFPLSLLQTIDLGRPKLLFNQPVLVEHVKCRIGTGIFEVTETTFRTLKHYEDSD